MDDPLKPPGPDWLEFVFDIGWACVTGAVAIMVLGLARLIWAAGDLLWSIAR